MRVLCLNPYLPPPLGGIEKEMLAVAAELRDLGHRVRILATTARFPRGENDRPDPAPDGIEVQALAGWLRSDLRGMAPSRAPLLVPGLARAALDFEPDLVLAFNIGWGPALRPALDALRARSTTLYRTFFHPPGGRLAPLKTRYLLGTVARADRAFVSTHAERRQLDATGLLDPGRVAVIAPGVSLHPEDPAGVERERARLRLQGKIVIAHVGRLCAFKGTFDLIEALPEVRRASGRDVVLLLIGADQGERDIAALAAARGVGESVRLAGEIRDDRALRALLASADLMALPSAYEAYGIAYLEALAEGLPCVGTDVGGVPEAIGEAGVLLPRFGDVAALTRILVELVADDERRRRLGALGRRRVREGLTWRHTAERILGLAAEARAARTGQASRP